jgi:hypothetical protein
MSFAEFVNRSAEAGSLINHKLVGRIQAAIDKSSINNQLGTYQASSDYITEYNLQGNVYDDSNSDMSVFDQDVIEGKLVEGIPAYLMQSDLLQCVGDVLSSRSDTFTIRAYGDYVDPNTKKVISLAWCEATVQRKIEFKDGKSYEQTPLNNNDVRKFEIISFRWFTENDI